MMDAEHLSHGPVRASLSPEEELALHQLQQLQFWQRLGKTRAEKQRVPEANLEHMEHSDRWDFTRGLNLHDWQQQCASRWFEAGKRGVVKVVTGAGKTLLGLLIAERLRREDPSLRLAIVVPSIVLLSQWRDEMLERSDLTPEAIGLMGGGHSDRFTDHTRVLIAVLNSAATKLKDEVTRAGVGQHLLLVVDECHRAGAAEMQQVFRTERAYSLGLSATPERDDEDDIGGDSEPDTEKTIKVRGFEDGVIGRELGAVIYELNYADAINQGILPPFTIEHYGLSLQPKETERYERVSREITDIRGELETGSRRGLALIRWCRSKSAANNPKAARLISLTSERKRLLYRIQERQTAVLRILEEALTENVETRAILFHESIDEVMSLFQLLRRGGHAVVAEHSGFSDALRAESLRLFRRGTARVIVSARSLIEGFNVPSADLGIIVAASASVRQRVQTLGRLLRKRRRADGTEKSARLCVLYAANTVDELIYEKADWEHFTGAERNLYYRWVDAHSSQPTPRPDPPRRPPISEKELNPAVLVPGAEYPGDTDEGTLYSVDTQGTVREEGGAIIEPHPELRQILAEGIRAGGRFRVTPVHRFVTRLEKTPQGWRGVYLGRLTSPIRLTAPLPTTANTRAYRPGDPYPVASVRGETYSVLQRDARLIARKTKGSIRFVRPVDEIDDPAKRSALQAIQRQLAEVYSHGHRISKITVTPEGHVVYVYQNEAYFVGHAPEGQEGFQFEGEAS